MFKNHSVEKILISGAFEYFIHNKFGISERTISRYKAAAEHLKRFFKRTNATQMEHITFGHVQDYMKFRKSEDAANKTINEEVRLLQATFKLLYDRGFINEIPLRGVKYLKEIVKRPDTIGFYSHDEVKKLKEYFRENNHKFNDYFLAFIYTGMRKGEVLALRKRDIDFAQNMITVRNFKTERNPGSLYRYIEIHPKFLPVLEERTKGKESDDLIFPEAQKKSKNWMLRSMTQACKELEIPWKRLHGLRHTFISTMLNSGVPLRAVMAMVGHTQPETTMRYAHISQEMLKGKITKLEY